MSNAFIATTLGRNISTIKRELRHNASPSGGYSYNLAQKLSDKRSNEASCRSSRICKESWSFTKRKLTQEQWSAEQISGELDELGLSPISHETFT